MIYLRRLVDKKYIIYRVTALVSLILMLVCVEGVFTYFLEPVSYATYFNHDIRNIEGSGEEVEMVFVGPSRTYRSYIPEVFEEEMGFENVINGGSAAQRMIGSYFELKDLTERFHPKYAILSATSAGIRHGVGDLQANLIIYDRLKYINRIQYIFAYFKDYPAYLLNSYRYRNEIGNIDENVKDRKLLEEEDYAPRTYLEDYYLDKGFVYNSKSVPDGNMEMLNRGRLEIDPVYEKYMDKCIKLCKDKGIQVIILTDPTSMMSIYGTDGYQEITDYIGDYAKKNGVIYHNVNYLKDREEFLPDSLMLDDNHVNGEGAKIISKKMAEVLKKDLAQENTDDYFYENEDEVKKQVNRIVAVSGELKFNDDKTAKLKMNCYRNDDITPMYQAEISYDGESYEILVPWTADRKQKVNLTEEEHFYLKIRAKGQNDNIGEAYQIYQY